MCYKLFKDGDKCIFVVIDFVVCGIDIECVNIVINYDMSFSADTYLYRVGRVGCFGIKGFVVMFVVLFEDIEVLSFVYECFEVEIKELLDEID